MFEHNKLLKTSNFLLLEPNAKCVWGSENADPAYFDILILTVKMAEL